MFVFPVELNQSMHEMKQVLCDLDTNGLQSLQQLRSNIENWRLFINKVDSMVEYLESKDDVIKQNQKPLNSVEIEGKKRYLEVFFISLVSQ